VCCEGGFDWKEHDLLDLTLLQPVHVEMDAICTRQWLVHRRDIKVERGTAGVAYLPSASPSCRTP
jgi:hypothetical protein